MSAALALLATPEGLALALGAVRLGRMALEQIDLAGLEKLPPEVRAQIEDERVRVNAAWARLAPAPPAAGSPGKAQG
jgi:hypothetical protein